MSLRDLIRRSAPRKVATDIADTMATVSAPADAAVSEVSNLSVATPAKRERSTGGWDASDWRAYFTERAAIAEFDGGMPRAAAEAQADECCIVEWLNQNPVRSPPGMCCGCGRGAAIGALAPYGLGPDLVWLHSGCWASWHAERRAEAKTALATMGVGPEAETTETQ